MKAVFCTLISILLLTDASAAPAAKSFSQKEINSLISSLKKHSATRKARIQGASVAKISLTPEAPKAGDTVVAYVQPATTYEGSETIFEATLDNQTKGLEQPANNMWVLNAGKMTEVRNHSLLISAFIQDKYEASRTRDAISALETAIADLDSQIAASNNPEEIAQLTAERDEKITQKNALVQQLANLRSPLGQQTLNFSIAENTDSPSYPHITSSSPSVGNVAGGTTITVTGSNFRADLVLTLGGITITPVTFTSSKIVFLAPQFSAEGFHDLEVRYTDNGSVKNAILKNAYFSTLQGYDPTARPTPPVAVAKAAANQVSLGAAASFTSTGSYDINGQSFHYEWRVISKPAGSTLVIPTNPPGNVDNFSFTPDVPGSYVVELRTFEDTAPFFASEPSLAVVEAVGPANRAPTGSATPITVGTNGVKTSQITTSDADSWQARSLFLTKQGALGTATLSPSGLVSYHAGAVAGTDSVEVTVVDNGSPPLSSIITIPIGVLANQAPVFNAPILARQKTQGVPYQARVSQNIGANGTVDPDGTIADIWWDFGDGTRERTLDRNSNFLFHNYMAPGSYTVTVTATDNLGTSSSQSTTLNITNTDIPTAKVRVSPFVGTFPLTVSFDASESSDADGIVQYRWFFSGTSAEQVTTAPTNTFTYNSPGTYTLRLRTIDVNGTEGETTIPVVVGTTSGGSQPQALPQAFPRMVTVGTSLDLLGGRSFSVFPGSTLTNYSWNVGDYFACPSNGCNVSGQNVNWTFQAPFTYYPGLQVTNSLGTNSNRIFLETIAVNSGTPPRAIARAASFSGVAPFALTVNANESYVYSGGAPITSYTYYWGDNTSTSGVTNGVASHTYATPGSYSLVVHARDSNGNDGAFTQTVNVTATAVELAGITKALTEAPADSGREYQRQVLTGACAQTDGEACYELGQMFGEDGNAFTKANYWKRACELGRQAACQE